MIWELGQDAPGKASLLDAVRAVRLVVFPRISGGVNSVICAVILLVWGCLLSAAQFTQDNNVVVLPAMHHVAGENWAPDRRRTNRSFIARKFAEQLIGRPAASAR